MEGRNYHYSSNIWKTVKLNSTSSSSFLHQHYCRYSERRLPHSNIDFSTLRNTEMRGPRHWECNYLCMGIRDTCRHMMKKDEAQEAVTGKRFFNLGSGQHRAHLAETSQAAGGNSRSQSWISSDWLSHRKPGWPVGSQRRNGEAANTLCCRHNANTNAGKCETRFKRFFHFQSVRFHRFANKTFPDFLQSQTTEVHCSSYLLLHIF